MKVARLAVLGVAVVAGFLAWRLASNIGSNEEGPVVVQRNVDTDEVLVANRDLEPGSVLTGADLSWESWPRDSINAAFVTRNSDPNAIEDLTGSVSRTSIFSGEPIRNSKLVKAGSSGFLAAMLPAGMRAVATKTSPQTGAGGFILPNDRVDVILTHRDEKAGGDSYVSETVLDNVRVLAIDQTVEEKDGRMVVVGNVATLELNPDQVEILSLAEQQGDISLSLRSIMDGDSNTAKRPGATRRGSVNVVKFGIPSRVNSN